ncbi:hypothetical protein JX265_011690 [Neoarthrinium moseri]|uniref:O-methyltransferase n=1 Tax=Neoarthrinium moseri TaxID=1658444 RepID=A0A9Q0AHF2_9PEZI|nr:hypothetical protein JX265_011690 [Neoarthrinium moseri]
MSISSALADLQHAADRDAEGDELAQMELLSGLQKLQNLLTTPPEKFLRMSFQMYQNVSVRLVQLSRSPRSDSMKLTLVVRLMRLITIIDIADEIGLHEYQANEATQYSIQRGILGDVDYCNMGPIASKTNIDAHAYSFGKPTFPWMMANQEHAQAFNGFMAARRGAMWNKWYNVYPVSDKVTAKEINESNLPGRIIVQDQPHVMTKLDGIDTMAHDIFTPQPISGGRLYYFKQIIHNWQDEQAVAILRNKAVTMKSRLLDHINRRLCFARTGSKTTGCFYGYGDASAIQRNRTYRTAVVGSHPSSWPPNGGDLVRRRN